MRALLGLATLAGAYWGAVALGYGGWFIGLVFTALCYVAVRRAAWPAARCVWVRVRNYPQLLKAAASYQAAFEDAESIANARRSAAVESGIAIGRRRTVGELLAWQSPEIPKLLAMAILGEELIFGGECSTPENVPAVGAEFEMRVHAAGIKALLAVERLAGDGVLRLGVVEIIDAEYMGGLSTRIRTGESDPPRSLFLSARQFETLSDLKEERVYDD